MITFTCHKTVAVTVLCVIWCILISYGRKWPFWIRSVQIPTFVRSDVQDLEWTMYVCLQTDFTIWYQSLTWLAELNGSLTWSLRNVITSDLSQKWTCCTFWSHETNEEPRKRFCSALNALRTLSYLIQKKTFWLLRKAVGTCKSGGRSFAWMACQAEQVM